MRVSAPWLFMAVALQLCPWAPGSPAASCAARRSCSLCPFSCTLPVAVFLTLLVFVLQCSHFLPSVSTTPEYSSCSSFPPLCAALRLCVCSCCAVPKVLMFPPVRLLASGRVTAAGSPFSPGWIGVQVESLPTCTYLLLLP